MRTRIAVALLVAVFAVACGDGNESGGTETRVEEPPTQLTGVILEVDAQSLTEVTGFTMRSEGETYEILLDPKTDLGFAPSHLNEHALSGDPVIVDLRSEDGKLYALSVVDA